jgi:hypothetical protein
VRDREREESWGGGVRDTTVLEGGVIETESKHNLAVWKVPRQCPLVLLLKDLLNFYLKDVGAAVNTI